MPDLTTEILADNPVVYYPLNETSGTQATNAAVKAKNLIANPSFETNTSRWTAIGSGATLTRDSGLWKAAYTADGTHPNATGHTALASALSLVKTTILGPASSS